MRVQLVIGLAMVILPLVACLGVGVYEAINGDTASQVALALIAWMTAGAWLIKDVLND